MLSQAILETVRYFDVQDHCLTPLDISKYLLKIPDLPDRPYSIYEIIEELEGSLKDQVQSHQGFYFLTGREELVTKRLHNNFYATKRLKRMKRYLPFVRHIPYVQAVGVGGSEALNNSKEGSDIDLLVITNNNRIWLARLFVTTYFQFLGMRRYKSNVADRFCLNHYLAEEKELSEDHNLYTAVEYASIVPYYGSDVLHRFHQKNYSWIKNFLAQPHFVRNDTPEPSRFKKITEAVLDSTIGDPLNAFVGYFQRKKIQPLEHIIISDDELSFHPDSKGRRVLAKYK
jgi:predicted nucleotidyltransferase